MLYFLSNDLRFLSFKMTSSVKILKSSALRVDPFKSIDKFKVVHIKW